MSCHQYGAAVGLSPVAREHSPEASAIVEYGVPGTPHCGLYSSMYTGSGMPAPVVAAE